MVCAVADSRGQYAKHSAAAFDDWLASLDPDWGGKQIVGSAFDFCFNMVQTHDPKKMNDSETAAEITAEMAQAVASLEEAQEQSRDFTYGDGQWHVLRMVLDWFKEWDKAFGTASALLDPAEYSTNFPIAFQFMSHSRITTMPETIPYIIWGQTLLERVVSHRECHDELKRAPRNEISYWQMLSRPCALLMWTGVRQLQVLKLAGQIPKAEARFAELQSQSPLFGAMAWSSVTNLHLQVPRHQTITKGWWDPHEFKFAKQIQRGYKAIKKVWMFVIP